MRRQAAWGGVLLAALTALPAAAAPAAAPTAPAAPATPLKTPAPVVVPDTLAQRLQPCTACHGAEGRASREGYLPRIAGKPAGYLYHQLLNFRDGRRPNATMAALLSNQTDAYLREMAEHFAALDLPATAAPRALADPALLARGQALVQGGDPTRQLPACTACHGRTLAGMQPATPGLLGLPRDYLVAQLGAWQTGGRRALAPDCMADIVRRLGPADAVAAAAWLAAQPVPATHRPEPAPSTPAPLACGSTGPAAR
jgi:cytochrome c553